MVNTKLHPCLNEGAGEVSYLGSCRGLCTMFAGWFRCTLIHTWHYMTRLPGQPFLPCTEAKIIRYNDCTTCQTRSVPALIKGQHFYYCLCVLLASFFCSRRCRAQRISPLYTSVFSIWVVWRVLRGSAATARSKGSSVSSCATMGREQCKVLCTEEAESSSRTSCSLLPSVLLLTRGVWIF